MLREEAPDENDDVSGSMLPLTEVLLCVVLFLVNGYAVAGQVSFPLPPSQAEEGAGAPSVVIEVDLDGRPKIDGATYTIDGLLVLLRDRNPSTVLINGHKRLALEEIVKLSRVVAKAGVFKLAVGVEE